MRSLFLVILLAGVSINAAAQPAEPRGGANEWSLNLLVIGSERYAFEGGASVRNEGGAGVGLTATHNLNNYFAFGVEATLAEFNYRASIAPGSGNPGAGFDSHGDMQTASLRAHATWNLLARPLTPFVSVAAGVILLDTNLASEPPADACWVYPWYGEVCGASAPRNELVRFTYGAGVGLRLDLPRNQGFIRAHVSGEWIEIPEAMGSVGYVQFRADFGLRF